MVRTFNGNAFQALGHGTLKTRPRDHEISMVRRTKTWELRLQTSNDTIR